MGLNSGRLHDAVTTAQLSAIGTQLAQKANSAQENWIVPTLLNSWENFSGIHASVGYYKDTMGVVHVKGVLKSGGVGVTCFVLPSGYRPSEYMEYASIAQSGVAQIEIGSDGAVVIASGSATWTSMCNISFRV